MAPCGGALGLADAVSKGSQDQPVQYAEPGMPSPKADEQDLIFRTRCAAGMLNWLAGAFYGYPNAD